MKNKIFTFLFALISVSAYASRDIVPTDAVLADYYEAGQVCVCIYVPDSIACNDIVFVGTYNNWGRGAGYLENAANCTHFEAIEGYDGWYVVAVDDETENPEGKPVMLDVDGNFNWSYQVGNATVLRGDVTVVAGLPGEIDLKTYGKTAPNVYTVDAWKQNLCTYIYHNYTVTVISDGCDGLVVPFIVGGMNNWNFQQMQLNQAKTIEYQVPTYDITFKTAEGTAYQFLSGLRDSITGEIDATAAPGWYDEAYIQKYDAENDSWVRFSGVTHETTDIVYDLRVDTLRWARCGTSSQSDLAAPATPTHAEEDVMALYCNHYAQNNLHFNAQGWGSQWETLTLGEDSTVVLYYQSATWDALTNWDAESYDLSDYEKFHFDIWAPFTCHIKLIFEALSTIEGGSGWRNGVYFQLNEGWNSVDCDLTSWDTENVTYDWRDVKYFLFDGYKKADAADLNDCSSADGNPLAFANMYLWGTKKHLTYNYDVSMGHVSGPTKGIPDSMISFTAIPNHGYHFTQWSDGVTDNPRTIVLTQDTTFTAEFARNTYTITTESNNPEWGTTTGDTTALYGDSVAISAIPNYGYHFDGWRNTKISSVAVLSVTEAIDIARGLGTCEQLSEQYAVTGYIVGPHRNYPNCYYIADTPDGETSFFVASESNKFAIGSRVVIAGYIISCYDDLYLWSEQSIVTYNPYSFVVTQDTTFTAFFEKNTYSINKESDPIQGSVYGPAQALYLDTITIFAVPKNGCRFAHWSDGNTDNPRTIVLTQDTTFAAKYEFLTSDKCGDHLALTWTYDSIGRTLTISGNDGLNSNYTFGVQAPSQAKHLIVEDSVISMSHMGVTQQFRGLESIVILNKAMVSEEQENSILMAGYDECQLKYVSAPAAMFGFTTDYYKNDKHYQHYFTHELDSIEVTNGELSENAWWAINLSHKNLKTIDLSSAANTELTEEVLDNYYNLCALKLPNNLMYVGYKSVAECIRLSSVVIPASVTEIDDRAFEDCRSLASVSFAGNVLTRIGNWAFYNCHALALINIPAGVIEIGDGAFYGCTYLNNLSLPASVQSIGDNAFALCSRIAKMDVDAITPPSVEDKTFFEVSTEAPVYVPDESVETYKAHPVWGRLNIVGKSYNPQAVENIVASENVQKILLNGTIFILRGDKVYTLQGQKIK